MIAARSSARISAPVGDLKRAPFPLASCGSVAAGGAGADPLKMAPIPFSTSYG
jgi:hypothetical protein